jgi:hypothetical protein
MLLLLIPTLAFTFSVEYVELGMEKVQNEYVQTIQLKLSSPLTEEIFNSITPE